MQYEVERATLQPGPGIAIRETHPIAELPSFFGSAFTELAACAEAAGAAITGPPFARYYSMPPGDTA